MKSFLPALLVLWCALAGASSPPSPARGEIDALLTRLRTSGCQFNRNGSWHSGAEASEHLLRKLEYIEDRGEIQSAEQFIELAASRSSFSGRAYQVRCADGTPEESRTWLLRQLAVIRASGSGGKP